MLVVLAILCIAVQFLPAFRIFHGVNLMPMWAPLLAELFSIIVSLILFGIVWNAYSGERSGNIVIFGCTALAVGLIDIARMLSPRGMPDFITASGPNKASISGWQHA